MKKKLLLVIIPVLLVCLAVILFFLQKDPPALTIKTTSFDVGEFAAQMEFINNLNSDIRFLTYRNTAVASLDSQGQGFKVLSEQVLPKGVDTVFWYTGGNKMLIKSFDNNLAINDFNSGYLLSTFQLGDNKPTYLPDNFHEGYLVNDKIFGVKNSDIYVYNGAWEKTSLTKKGEIIVSSRNKYLVLRSGKVIEVYDSEGKLIRTLETDTEEGKIRVFSNLEVAEIYEDKVVIHKPTGEKQKITIDKKSQILFGTDIFLYTKDKKSFAYFPLKNTKYKMNISEGISFINLYGLSDLGAIYFTGENNSAESWSF